MTAIRTFFQEFWNRIPQIGVNDIIDILIVAFLFYTVMRLIRSTSAARIARSILLLLVWRQILHEPHQQRRRGLARAAGDRSDRRGLRGHVEGEGRRAPDL